MNSLHLISSDRKTSIRKGPGLFRIVECKMNRHRHTTRVLILAILFVLPIHLCKAQEASSAKIDSASLLDSLTSISKWDWPLGVGRFYPRLRGRGRSLQYQQAISKLKKSFYVYRCGEIEVIGRLIELQIVDNQLWLQIARKDNQKPLTINCTETAKRLGSTFKIDDIDIERTIESAREFINKSPQLLRDAKEAKTILDNIDQRAKNASSHSSASKTPSILEDANPGQDSRHFSQVLNFPSDYEGKTLRWLGRFMELERNARGGFGLGLNFRLASKMVTSNSKVGFRVSETMARELSKHSLKPHDAQVRVLFTIEKAGESDHYFKVISIMFRPLASQSEEALAVATQDALRGGPISSGRWVKVTASGKTVYTSNYKDYW